jgi:hypothetical protein
MEDYMKALISAALAVFAIVSASQAWAHGDAPHPKCKKGYVINDEHKCVKKG